MLLEAGGQGCSAIALDKHTGKLLWQAGDDPAGYASPIIVQPSDNPGIAYFNAFGLVVRTAREGRELWRFPWKTDYDVNAATPIPIGTDVFISSGYNHGAALVRPAGAGGNATAVWETKAMRNQINSSVYWEGHLYGFDESTLTCLEAATGKVKWTQRGLGKGSLMLADGRLVILAESGRLVIARPSPNAYTPLAEAQVLGKDRCWSVPVLADGRIFAKNNLGQVVALNVRAP